MQLVNQKNIGFGKIASSIFLLWTTFGFCQFGIISDQDGFVNVRTDAKIGNNISDKLPNGFAVYVFERKDNWINIDYDKDGKDKNGYIYKDRVKFVSDFPEVKLETTTSDKAILKNKNIRIEITTDDFIPKNHKLSYHEKQFLSKIDGKKFYGTDGNIPKREYRSIKIEVKGKLIELPKTAFQDLFEPTLWNSKANYDEANDILYIHSMNSDGAGGYDVIWIIEKGEYKTRAVEYGF